MPEPRSPARGGKTRSAGVLTFPRATAHGMDDSTPAITRSLNETEAPCGSSSILPRRVRGRAPHRDALRDRSGRFTHRDDGIFPLRRRRRRRACRAAALGVALGVSSIAHSQMCRARAAIGLGGAARDPPRVRRGRRARRRRPRVVYQGGARVRAPPARYVPRAKPRRSPRETRERSLIVHLGGREERLLFFFPLEAARVSRASSLAPLRFTRLTDGDDSIVVLHDALVTTSRSTASQATARSTTPSTGTSCSAPTTGSR